VSHASQPAHPRIGARWLGTLLFLLVITLLFSGRDSSAQKEAENPEPSVRIPSNVAWTREALAIISRGDAFHGLLRARLCNHCNR
jgi:hypothetical protein